MKSNEDVKVELQNSPMITQNFFFNNYDIDFSRVGLLDRPVNDGISIQIKDDKSYILKINDGVAEVISTYSSSFFLLQIFLDQYRGTEKPFPIVNPSQHPIRSSWYKNYDELKQAMQIMIMSLNTYEDFIKTIRFIEKTFNRAIIYPEIEIGNISTWSWGNTVTRDNLLTVDKCADGSWQILNWQRGHSEQYMTVFDEKYIFEFFIEIYLSVF